MYMNLLKDNYESRSKYFFILPFFAIIGLILSTSTLNGQDLDVPYVPTPQNVVDQMLDLADVNSGDYVIDLGSGDGRIVISAAKRGATGHGIDLDPQRVSEARGNAKEAGVDNRVMFMEQDIFDTDFSNASVITMYLLPTVNLKLRPELLNKLEPGTRIVSHSFDMDGWKPDKEVTIRNDGSAGRHDIFFWVIPAKANGTWEWEIDGKSFSMNVEQQFQEIDVALSDGDGNGYSIESADLRGKRINIHAVNGSERYIFSGRIEDGKISGVSQHHVGDNKNFAVWTATKN